MGTESANQPRGKHLHAVVEIVCRGVAQRAILVVLAAIVVGFVGVALKAWGVESSLPLFKWLFG